MLLLFIYLFMLQVLLRYVNFDIIITFLEVFLFHLILYVSDRMVRFDFYYQLYGWKCVCVFYPFSFFSSCFIQNFISLSFVYCCFFYFALKRIMIYKARFKRKLENKDQHHLEWGGKNSFVSINYYLHNDWTHLDFVPFTNFSAVYYIQMGSAQSAKIIKRKMYFYVWWQWKCHSSIQCV